MTGVVGINAFPSIHVGLVVIVKVEFVGEGIAARLSRTSTRIAQRETNAVRHAHRAYAAAIILPPAFLDITIMTVGPAMMDAIRLGRLKSSDLVEHNFESTLSNMNLALKFASLFVPRVFISSPKVVNTFRVFFLAAYLLLGCIQAFLHIC